jgi:H+/Cl- antiporter ClcA
MKRVWQIIWTACRRVLLFLGCSVALATDVLARDTTGKSESSGNSAWVWAYILVILGVALGMLVVCKSSGRRDRAKPEAYGEGKGSADKKEEKNNG